MTVGEYLKKEAKIGEIVIFRDGGWQVGMTRIDSEGFYMFSLNPTMLELFDVICYAHERRNWIIGDVLVLDIKRSEDCL